jgi:hypothetical protein
MSPDWRRCWPQQVWPPAQVCPLHGVWTHLPPRQNGVGAWQGWLHPPQFFGSLVESMLQVTPLQQIMPGMQVGHWPPPELLELPLELLLPEELPLSRTLLEDLSARGPAPDAGDPSAYANPPVSPDTGGPAQSLPPIPIRAPG